MWKLSSAYVSNCFKQKICTHGVYAWHTSAIADFHVDMSMQISMQRGKQRQLYSTVIRETAELRRSQVGRSAEVSERS
jgi:hypothetical protein